MSLHELLGVVSPPEHPVGTGNPGSWDEMQTSLGIGLPPDVRDFALRYGTGYFDDPGRLMIWVWTPFCPGGRGSLDRRCEELRQTSYPCRVFPDRPGWLPWGNDIDGSLLCWLTEGEPDDWPLILLSAERTSFQQLQMSMTTFLARAFTRQIQTILWDDPVFFSGPQPVRFVPGA
jgi:hypothetical protein